MLILVNCFFTIVDRLVQAHLLKGNKDFSISIPMCFLAVARGEVAHWGHAITSAGKNTWFLVVMS